MLRRRSIIALFAAATCLSQAAANTNATAESQIRQIESATGGRIGVCAVDVRTNTSIQNRARERFPMCSTFKLLAVGAVLQQVNHRKESLDRFIPYTQADILDYAPVTKEHVQDGGMTLGALCQAAIEQSDNTAGNLVLQTLGGPAGLTKFVRTLWADDVTRLDRNEPELNDVAPGDDRDSTSPAMMYGHLSLLLLKGFLSADLQSHLTQWLESSQTGAALIRAGVPAGWRVGDKTGRSHPGATNDVGVIYPPDGTPIFIAIYIFNPSASDEQRSEVISKIAHIVCDAFRPNLMR